MEQYNTFSSMIDFYWKRLSSKSALSLVKDEQLERVDIFCGEWEIDVFSLFCNVYKNIDLWIYYKHEIIFAKKEEIISASPFIILGGVYGWKNYTELELLAVAVFDVEEGIAKAYTKDANPVPSLQHIDVNQDGV